MSGQCASFPLCWDGSWGFALLRPVFAVGWVITNCAAMDLEGLSGHLYALRASGSDLAGLEDALRVAEKIEI